jgi:amino acid adenylation domain-containing protein
MAHILAERSELQPDSKAYTYLADGEHESCTLTFGELHQRVKTIAFELSSRKLFGTRALLLYPSELEFISAFLGCLYAGVIAVPCPYPARSRNWPRVLSIAKDCEPTVILTSEKGSAQLRPRIEAPDWPTSCQLIATDNMMDSGCVFGPVRDMPRTAFLQYTSGSTSDPRGVIVTHDSLMHNEAMIQQAFSQSSDDIIAGWLPLYHDMGLIGTVLQPLYVGSHSILMPAAVFLQRPARWLEAISRYRATTSGGPNFAWDLCTRRVSEEDLGKLNLSSWQVAFNGAEPVRAETIEAFTHRFSSVGFSRNAFQPCYGLAEATLLVSAGSRGRGPVVARFDRPGIEAGWAVPASSELATSTELVGCGSGWSDQQLRIVDPVSGVPLSPGLIGEIQISGTSVADGYWNHPKVPEETFVTIEDRTWLRSGDLGFLSSNELFITGRLKDLIILRGRNIYPQDLEAVSASAHKSTQPNAAAAFAIEHNGSDAVVLIQELSRSVADSAENIAIAIREAIAREHEVQLLDVVLLGPGELPRTSSGKVRRGYCRTQYLTGVWRGVAVGAMDMQTVPELSTVLLQETINMVASVLKVGPASISANFTLVAAGLDSLRAIDLVQRIEDCWGIKLLVAELLEGMTVAELAERGTEQVATVAEQPSAQASLVLTPGQKTLLTLDSISGHASPNNLFGACWLEGPVDIDALFQAAYCVVARHSALQTTLSNLCEDTLVERPSLGADCAIWDLSAFDEAELRQAIAEEGSRPFDVVHGPLLRLRVGSYRDERLVLLITLHHMAGDLRSLEIILNELGALYAEAVDNLPAHLPVPVPFAAFAGHQSEWLAGKDAERTWSFWQHELSNLTLLELPYDHARSGAVSLRGDMVRQELSVAATEAAKMLARKNGSTLYAFLLSVFQTFLHRYTGVSDIVVGSSFLGRDQSRFSNTVGYFTNPLPLRASLQDDPTFQELLSRNTVHMRQVMRHASLPGALLAQKLGKRTEGGLSLYRVYFVFEQASMSHQNLPAVAIGTPGASIEVGPLKLSSIGVNQNTSQFDLLLYVAEYNGGMQLALNYDTDLFERGTVKEVLSSIASLITSAVETPEQRVHDSNILDATQRDKQLQVWNKAGQTHSVSGGLYERFEETAQLNLSGIAVVDGIDELTYGELVERSRCLSAVLREAGVGVESRVPLLLRPGANQIVAILAVLQVGAAYVPLDVLHPTEHLAYMVKDALDGISAAILVAEQGMEEIVESIRCKCGISIYVIDAVQPPPTCIYPAVKATPDNAAYVIYTSGSTGKPKGVINTHGNVLRLFAVTEEQFHFSAADTWTMFHSYAFDFSVWEIWGALLYGGRLVIVPYETRLSPLLFYHLLRSEAVTVLCQTPSAFRQLTDLAEPWGKRHKIVLRTVIFGGEALELASLATWRKAFESEPPELVNMYGITETTVHVTYRLLKDEELTGAHRSLIGRPIGDLQVYLLDTRLNLLPAGAIGEIFVGGAGLARGYLHRRGLTAERFLPNPFSSLPGDRLYRSGDLARYLPNGELEYLGRIDHQVKIRGHRIELGEIQHALNGHPLVAQALVLSGSDRQGEARLIAYICGQIPRQSLGTELREFLLNKLPSYMIPAAFVYVDHFSLTANGKIDRRALPALEAECESTRKSSSGSMTATESALGLIWTELLGVTNPAPDDSFFALGGHSLLVMRTVKRVREVFGVDLPVAQVFATPSLAEIASNVDKLRGLPVLPPIHHELERSEFPLSFAQERVWLSEQLRTGTSLFNIPITLELIGDLDIALLRNTLQHIVDRHEILRTSFMETPSGPVQNVWNKLEVSIETAEVESEQELAFLCELEAQRPFELRNPPLLRLRLVRLSAKQNILLLTMHHIIFDLWSAGILIEEVARTYAAFSRGLPDPLMPLSIQYGDFARWERTEEVLDRLNGQAAFWSQELANADFNFTVPLDRPRPETSSAQGGLKRHRFDEGLCGMLQALRLRNGVTLYVLLLTVFKVLLRHISKADRILVGTDVAGREIYGVQPLIGMFVNQIPLCTMIEPTMTFDDALARVRDTATRAWANRNIPAQHIGRPPLFRVLFDLQDFNLPSFPDSPIQVRRLDSAWTTAKYDISLFVEEENGSLTATLEYNADVLTSHSAETMLSHYVRLLEQIAADPHRPINEYVLMEERAKQSIASVFNEDLEER